MSSELRAPLYNEEKLSDKSLKEMKVQVLDSVKCVLKKFNCNYKFQTLHYKVYTIVKNMHGQQLYFRLVHLIERHCKVNVRTNILVNFNVNFLESIVQAMEDHKTAMGIIMDIFIYLDRAIVQYMEIGSVYNMGIKMFLNHVIKYERIKDHLSDTLLALIAEDRKGGVVDTNLIKRACSVLSGLGHSVYYEHFERPFVLQSVRFFQDIAIMLLSSKECSIADYLNKVEKFITDEEFRACMCFEQSTKNAITKVIKTEMLENKLQLIIAHETTGLSYMLNYEKISDLKLMYKMVGTIKEGIFVMTQYLSKYFREVGKSTVEKYSSDDKDAIEFVQRIIDLTEKVSNYLTTCFDQDPIPYKTFSKDYEYVINLDARMPCHLAKYCNNILSIYSDDSVKQDALLNVDKALKLFRNLREKDLFEDLYRKLMARRLLDNRFSTEEVETAVISKLEYECGNNFTYKMRNMLKDLVLSKAKNEEFQKQISETREGNKMQFQINVLTSGFWPFHTYLNLCCFPSEVYEQFEHFSRFYICRHIGRKLMLQPDFGTADILVKSLSGNEQTVETESKTQMTSTIFQVSTYQMCILLLFNEADNLTFKELQCKTDIKERSLKAALEPMFSKKNSTNILIKNTDVAEITNDDIFTVNTMPIYEQEIVKYQPLCIPDEVETEEKKTKETVALDRKDEIDLVIVRLLKKMKIMRHNDLIDQVIKLLSHRFIPSPLLINNRIECLIDRDYLERLKDDVQSYRYLA